MLKKTGAILILFIFIFISCTNKTIIKNEKIKKLNLEVISLNLYLGNEDNQSFSDRVYNNNFSLNRVNFIWYDLILVNNSLYDINSNKERNEQTIVLREVWTNEIENTVISTEERELLLPLSDKYTNYSAGFSNYPNWETGQYSLKIFINNKEYSDKKFNLK